MNIPAKLSTTPLQSESSQLTKWVNRVLFVEMDRIYAEVKPRFFKEVRNVFLGPDATVHPTHRRLLTHASKPAEQYKLESYREDRGSGSL